MRQDGAGKAISSPPILQAVLVGNLCTKLREDYLIAAGSVLMGAGLILLLTARTQFLVMVYIALFAVGIAAVLPSTIRAHLKDRPQEHGQGYGDAKCCQ